MKKIVLICHDPGGYDVIHPVYEKLKSSNEACCFFPIGPSKKMAGEGLECSELLVKIKTMIKSDELGMLVTGTSWGNDIEVKCIELCNSNGIPTVAVLDYWSNYKMRFCYQDCEKYVFPTKYFVMDEIAYREAVEDGIDANILEITGSPGLDKYIAISKEKRASNAKKDGDILFLSDPISELYGTSLGYTEESVFLDILDVCNVLGRKINIKFHPKDNEYMRKKYSSYEVAGNLDDVVPKFDLAIGMSTMALLHSYFWGVPIISYQPGLIGKDMCITNILGITNRIDSKEELKELLAGKVSGGGKENRKPLIWEDGKSTDRVCERLISLLKS